MAMDIVDLEDMIDVCIAKVSFVEDFFTQIRPDSEPTFSKEGLQGISFILDDVVQNLGFINNELSIIKKEVKS